MVKNWRYRLVIAATHMSMLFGVGTGVAMSASSCPDEGIGNCGLPTGAIPHTCCVAGYLSNCTQNVFDCVTGTSTSYRLGQYYACTAYSPTTPC